MTEELLSKAITDGIDNSFMNLEAESSESFIKRNNRRIAESLAIYIQTCCSRKVSEEEIERIPEMIRLYERFTGQSN